MKNKFLKILTTCVLSGCTIGSLVTLGSCGTSKTENKISPFGLDNQNGYCVVNFLGGPGVTFSGQTHVKVPKGSYFASVNTPVAQHGKLKFDCWSKKLNTRDPISSKQVIDSNLDVYALFKDETDLSQCVGMAAIEQTTITVAHSNGQAGNITQSLEFSTTYGETWTNINDDADHAIELAPGDTVFFKGNNPTGFNRNDYPYNIYFKVSEGGEVNVIGNIMGLLDDATGNTTAIPCANCFEGLFQADGNNYGIKYVSNSFLPATTLADSCYLNLFNGHKSLLTAPWLPAKQLVSNCYNHMFYDCELLDFIKLDYSGNFLQGTEYPYTSFWVDGISEGGTIIYNGEETDKGRSSIPSNWIVKKAPDPSEYDVIQIDCVDEPVDNKFVDNHPYQFTATIPGDDVFQDVTWVSDNTSVATVNPETGVVTPIKPGTCNILAYSKVDQTVGGHKEVEVRDIELQDCTIFSTDTSQTISWDYGGPGILPNFKYSFDGKNWFDFVTGVTITSNTPIYVKGNNPNGIGSSNSHTRFIFDESEEAGDVYISGSVKALVDDARNSMKTVPSDYCFNLLFSESYTKLKSVDPDYLSHFENLSVGCFKSMFQYCELLKDVPKLPYEALANECYLYMFRGCLSLTKAPDLPATTLTNHCYKGMFYGCISLEESPELKAETATLQCYYQMFTGCLSLQKIGYIHLKTFPQIQYLWCCREMFYKVSETLFVKDGGTKFFVCPDIDPTYLEKYLPVTDMFRWDETVATLEPQSGEQWGYGA